MSDELQGKRVAFIVANDGVEEVELTEPWTAVERAGGTAVLLAPQAGKVQAYHHLDRAESFEVDELIADADPAEFDAIVLPGGVANPDQLRTDEDAVLAAAVAEEEAALGDDGRILLRPSGTEQLVRVMVEAVSADLAQEVADRLAVVVHSQLAL